MRQFDRLAAVSFAVCDVERPHPDLRFLSEPITGRPNQIVEGQFLFENFSAGGESAMNAFRAILDDAVNGNNRLGESEMVPTIWNEFVRTAERFNEPGSFTAMTGYEWTSTPNGDNLHRVVILADGAEKTSQTLPYSMFDSVDPEDLWDYLAAYEETTGGPVSTQEPAPP